MRREAENLGRKAPWDWVSAVKSAGSRLLIILFIFFAPAASLCAQNLTGKVNNGTTGKPAAGDSIALMKLGQGMKEVAHGKTDAGGHFSFRLPDPGPHLIQALHQGVTYYRMAPPGVSSTAIQVFDVSRKVGGIRVTADVMRFQAQGNELQGIRLFAVNNASSPPRTQVHGEDFEFFLPDGAVIDQGIAMTAGGQPIKTSPLSEKEKNRYGFAFPLRPGETEFQVAFHMGYSGNLSVDPRELYGAEHFVVMVPKTMLFTAAPGIIFQAMQDPRQSDALVQVMSDTRAGQPLGFTISGTGILSEPGDDSLGAPHPVRDETVPRLARDSNPGKSAAVPAHPAETYRGYVLAGLLFLLLGGGGVYFVRRSRTGTVVHSGSPDRKAAPRTSAAPKPSSQSDLLLDRFKNDLFQLEVEHQQGRISQRKYKRARAALDQTLERAIKRAQQK